MIDYCLKVPASAINRRTPLKNALAGLFLSGRMTECGSPAYLFSQEPLMDGAQTWLRVRMVQAALPASAAGLVIEKPVSLPSEGDRVVVTGWLAVKTRIARKYRKWEAREVAIAEKLLRYQDLLSDGIEIDSARLLNRPDTAVIERGKTVYVRNYGRVEFRGVVKNAQHLEHAMQHGIGAAKAYGFGLLDVRKED